MFSSCPPPASTTLPIVASAPFAAHRVDVAWGVFDARAARARPPDDRHRCPCVARHLAVHRHGQLGRGRTPEHEHAEHPDDAHRVPGCGPAAGRRGPHAPGRVTDAHVEANRSDPPLTLYRSGRRDLNPRSRTGGRSRATLVFPLVSSLRPRPEATPRNGKVRGAGTLVGNDGPKRLREIAEEQPKFLCECAHVDLSGLSLTTIRLALRLSLAPAAAMKRRSYAGQRTRGWVRAPDGYSSTRFVT